MSRKNRSRGHVSQSGLNGQNPQQEIERFLANRRFKDAIKQAKILIQRENSPENRTLLEKASFLRIEQLYQGGMPSSAAEVAGHLLETGVQDEGILKDLLRLLPALGMGTKAFYLAGRIDSPELRQELTARTADQTVLHPEQSLSIPQELQSGAMNVRAALQALDAGDEALAFEQLRDVPRQSPFADWRLFVRGLAAFRRGDMENVAPNWDRLDPNRCGHRIAKRLRDFQRAPDTSSEGAATRTDLSALEIRVFGEPVLARLDQLDRAVRSDRWPDAFRVLASLRHSLRRVDVALAQRLTEILLHPLVDALQNREDDDWDSIIGDFVKVIEPPAFDPQCNRIQAILLEREGSDLQRAIGYWCRYIQDLEQLTSVPPEERQAMHAVVVRHIGELYAVLSKPDKSPFVLDSFFSEDEDDDCEDEEYADDDSEDEDEFDDAGSSRRLRQQAIEAIEESLRLDSSRKETFDLLFRMHQNWEQPDEAAAAAKRLLEAFPDDLDRLQHLARYHQRRDEPIEALKLFERARQLKPLDQSIAENELIARQGVARHHALAGRWDEGRAEFARVEAAGSESQSRAALMARKAAFEFKAGQTASAEAIVADELDPPNDQTAFWLEMSIQAVRYRLAQDLLTRFSLNFQKGLAKKVNGGTAARISTILGAHLLEGVEYPGREQHVKEVLAYLKRGARSKFTVDELLDVCAFLTLVPKAEAFFNVTVKRGVKKFPDSPDFLYFAARNEVAKGPFAGNLRQAQQNLERALELLQEPDRPRKPRLVEDIKQTLSILRNLPEPEFSFGGPGGFGSPRGVMKMIQSMMGGGAPEDEELPDDDDDQSFGRASKPRSARRKFW